MDWKTWIVPVAAAIGTVAGGRLAKGWTGVIVGALAGVAAGLAVGAVIDRSRGGVANAPRVAEAVEP